MSKIKECFVSRFPGGVLMQFDYSQLEIRVLALLSNCYQLKTELKAGIDLHASACSWWKNVDYQHVVDSVTNNDAHWIALRREAKRLRFLIQYGGSANALHNATGIPVPECQSFIKNYYHRYPEIGKWHDELLRTVNQCSHPSRVIKNNRQMRQSALTSETGRRYVFHEETTKWGKTGFSPTKIKNYPVQGLATGDVVLTMLGRFNRWLKQNYPDVLLINTIHDSIMVDVPNTVIHYGFARDAVKFLETAPQVMKQLYGMEWDIELPVDVESGRNWGKLNPMDLTINPKNEIISLQQ